MPTIERRLEEPKYREAWEAGLGQGRVSLRRTQMAMAEKNATMAIFLGKQYLGQKDQAEIQHKGDVVFRMNFSDDA